MRTCFPSVCWIGAGLFLAGCATPPATKEPAITVRAEPPLIEHHTFPPHRPPPHLTFLPAIEMGFCETEFGFYVQFGVEYPRWSHGTSVVTVTSIRMTTDLKLRLWSWEGFEASVLPHEETHRAISERYYRDAEATARRVAQAYLGRKIAVSGRITQPALEAALEPLQHDVYVAYRHETHDRCQFAQARFDEITDHGRAPVTNEEAMARAIADEETNWRERTAAPKT